MYKFGLSSHSPPRSICLCLLILGPADLSLGDDIRTIERNTDVLLNACKDIGFAVNTGRN